MESKRKENLQNLIQISNNLIMIRAVFETAMID